MHLPNGFADTLSHLLGEISNGNIMDLDPKGGVAEIQLSNRTVIDIPLHEDQVFVKAPRLVLNNLINSLQIIKYKQGDVVPRISNPKAICGSPNLSERSSHDFCVQETWGQELCC